MSMWRKDPWPKDVANAIRRLNELCRRMEDGLVDRGDAVRLLGLATLCQEHILALGPPGVAKTMLATRFAQSIDARFFAMQLTRFSEPSELFGPLDIEKFRAGVYSVRTATMLADVEIGFLDEVFEANSSILNSLLALMNERVFHNGATAQKAPLLTLFGASNKTTDDQALAAFADRFLLRVKLDAVRNDRVRALLDLGWKAETDRIVERPAEVKLVTVTELRSLHCRLAEVDLQPVIEIYENLILRLRRDGVAFSDRRAVRGLKLIAGATLMRGASVTKPEDMWPVRHMWVREDDEAALAAAVDEALGADPAGADDSETSPELLRQRLDDLAGETMSIESEVGMWQHVRALGTLRRDAMRAMPESAPGDDEAVDEAFLAEIDRAIDTAQDRLETVEARNV
jgi:MoxR-like ATPase